MVKTPGVLKHINGLITEESVSSMGYQAGCFVSYLKSLPLGTIIIEAVTLLAQNARVKPARIKLLYMALCVPASGSGAGW
jgi:hypothetical protein